MIVFTCDSCSRWPFPTCKIACLTPVHASVFSFDRLKTYHGMTLDSTYWRMQEATSILKPSDVWQRNSGCMARQVEITCRGNSNLSRQIERKSWWYRVCYHRGNFNSLDCPSLQKVLQITRPAYPLACENIRFSSLFAPGDVSRGETSLLTLFSCKS